jgi:hypothetical protein
MKITVQHKVDIEEFEHSSLSQGEIDTIIKREVFIEVSQKLNNYIPILKTYSNEPTKHFLYEGQLIILGMDSFRNLMVFLEAKLNRQDYLEIRELLNEKL